MIGLRLFTDPSFATVKARHMTFSVSNSGSKSAGPVRWLLTGVSALLFALSLSRSFAAFATLPIECAARLVERGDAIPLAGLERIIARFCDTDSAPLGQSGAL